MRRRRRRKEEGWMTIKMKRTMEIDEKESEREV